MYRHNEFYCNYFKNWACVYLLLNYNKVFLIFQSKDRVFNHSKFNNLSKNNNLSNTNKIIVI